LFARSRKRDLDDQEGRTGGQEQELKLDLVRHHCEARSAEAIQSVSVARLWIASLRSQ
jgi:hypothetical protein